jgi:two-component system osmolarity sensor histidine kinase EnvZ
MIFQWLKHYMPRGIYGRTALILILPVLAVQIVVSFVFIREDLEDVTIQMSDVAASEIQLLLNRAEAAGSSGQFLQDNAAALAALDMSARFAAAGGEAPSDYLPWNEYSGRVVKRQLESKLPQLLAVQFQPSKRTHLFFETSHGVLEISFSRRRVTVTAPHQMLVTMLFFGLIVTAVCFLYMRNQLRPIKKLADAAQAFGRGRNLSYTPRGATEVRAAGSAFLDMRSRIERQIEQRTLMLSGVSHDLRTPLTRMKLELSMMDPQDAGPLLQDVDEMQQMLDAFLDFSRGAAASAPEPVNPHALAAEIVDNWRREEKDVMLGELSGSGTVELRAFAIRRAVDNLIGNAVRYGTRARLSVAITEKSLRIRVEDDGPGIPEEQRIEAQRPFTRLDPARNQNKGTGVGLGLAIVADAARAHGGVLRLGRSEALGGLQADIVIGR